MPKSYEQLLVFGTTAKDEILTLSTDFKSNINKDNIDKLNLSFLVEKLEQEIGGTALNICYNFKLLSDKPCYILSGVGKDGSFIVDFLKANNVDTKYLIQSQDLYTGTYKVLTDIDQNQVGGFYFGANKEAQNYKLEEISNHQNSLLVLSANYPDAFLSVQDQAINLGIDYVYDVGMCLSWIQDDDLLRGLKNATYLIANEYEIEQIFTRLKLSIEEIKGFNTILIQTLGKKGVKYIDSNNEYLVPGFVVDNVEDPTGAGDSFRGGFFASFMDDKSILDSLKIGNSLASFSVEKRGGVNHKPSIDLINSRIL